MATVIIAIVVFGIVGLDVAYLTYNGMRHTGKFSCSECNGNCSECYKVK